jgi:hypothetical protein
MIRRYDSALPRLFFSFPVVFGVFFFMLFTASPLRLAFFSGVIYFTTPSVW